MAGAAASPVPTRKRFEGGRAKGGEKWLTGGAKFGGGLLASEFAGTPAKALHDQRLKPGKGGCLLVPGGWRRCFRAAASAAQAGHGF